MLFLNTIILIALLGRAAYVVNSSSTTNGSWEEYNEFYFLLLDGSTPDALLINAAFRVYHSNTFSAVAAANDYRKRFHTVLADPFLMIAVICLLPAFLTHIIPGLLKSPFLPIVGIVLVATSMNIRTKLPSNVDTLNGKLLTQSATTIGCIARQVIFRQVVMFVMFVCTAGVQFASNYMMMFYAARNGTLTVSSGSWAGSLRLILMHEALFVFMSS
ncbi:GPI-anchored surface protein, putative [Bodo saltans]|uniref:GPI-anchored surface protein, putative n=1 Tax=Bodo saltans TaxID=75058 RepID=A0A0S4J4P8_BODSA|nr:GPI-anchored surface protein, putative [Bodo saltans]|eukprot:CUG46437.1 GPI-anchored surface protein, putative [Bodo saltans]